MERKKKVLVMGVIGADVHAVGNSNPVPGFYGSRI